MATIERPPVIGLWHLALHCNDLEACLHFYHQIMGMKIEWQPDDDNIYLTNGHDNLALHRTDHAVEVSKSTLDHLGFFLHDAKTVYQWHQYLVSHEVKCGDVREHRDGAVSFYCVDPDGNSIQMICHPPIIEALATNPV